MVKFLLNIRLKKLENEQKYIKMENQITKVGVSVIIINKKNEVLVGKRMGSHGAGLLSVPGGHLEYGESYNTACDRELSEEIGVNFEGKYDKLGFSEDFFFHNGQHKHYITLYFVVKNVDSNKIKIENLEPNKCEGWNWINISKLPTEMFCDTYDQIKLLM